ncbi:MAG: CTP synthase [bacterium]
MPKYIFIAGGVMSGVGKGITSASMGKILQSRGLNVTSLKIDPYVNVDAGTMNPTEHGEVFVLDDGAECDQDMGNYERFLNRTLSAENYMTTGSIYQKVINRERNLEYNGHCVEVVPHIPMEVIAQINRATKKDKADIVIIEIGGTVGEYQNILFLEAVRMLKLQRPRDVLLALVSFLPLQSGGELKTKPTQYAARTINSAGLQPDIIIARAALPLDEKRKEKIAMNCNVKKDDVISAPDVANIYEVPLIFEKQNLSNVILKKLNLKSRGGSINAWRRFVENSNKSKRAVKIAIVGKYFSTGSFILADSYISVIEAIKHAAFALHKKPEITWLSAEDFDPTSPRFRGARTKKYLKRLKDFDGVIVPGGFGGRGVEGKIAAIKYLRENKIPFLGLCYGMQLAVVEYARHKAKLAGANTTEVNPKTSHPVIMILPGQKENLLKKNYGGTMRLGAYQAILKAGTIARRAYGKTTISERHRHRYEVNPDYSEQLIKSGLVISGTSPDGTLAEIVELPQTKHPFFLAAQFHPEFTSRPLSPNPLFLKFIKSAVK